jgi:glycosyltransferase involved in cell wall biosynthesis
MASSTPLIFDSRWIGPHGIGRFAREVSRDAGFAPLDCSGTPMSALDSWRVARALARCSSDSVFFSPGYNAPLFSRRPFVFTVHDLNHIDRPENSSALKRLYYRTVLKSACHRAAAVLTVSQFSKQRLIDWAGLDAAQVFNVGNGVDTAFNAIGPRHQPGFPYLLVVGNRKGHKNEHRAVAAFAQAVIDPAVHLLFIGQPNPDLQICLARHDVAHRAHFVGHVSDALLPALYRGATALLFPSLYEGFGLPVLEAFACGVPVITSTVTSLPEVAGDAACLVDPLSVDDIAGGIARVLNDQVLRTTLRCRGLARAQLFQWPQVAGRVQAVLQAVLAGQRAGDSAWPVRQGNFSETT